MERMHNNLINWKTSFLAALLAADWQSLFRSNMSSLNLNFKFKIKYNTEVKRLSLHLVISCCEEINFPNVSSTDFSESEKLFLLSYSTLALSQPLSLIVVDFSGISTFFACFTTPLCEKWLTLIYGKKKNKFSVFHRARIKNDVYSPSNQLGK